MKYKCLLFFFRAIWGFAAAMLLPGTSYAQQGSMALTEQEPLEDFITAGTEMSYFQRFYVERRLERILMENLGRFFHPELFFVAVKFEEERLVGQEADRGPALGLTEPSTPPPLISRDPEFFLERLPGLPQYSGSERAASAASEGSAELMEVLEFEAIAGQRPALFELGKLDILYILDPKIEVGMEDLIRKLTEYSLKISDEGRLSISFERAPLYGLLEEELETKSGVDSLRVSLDLTLPQDGIFSTDRGTAAGLLDLPVWVYLLLGLLALLFIYLLLLLVRGSRESDRKSIASSKQHSIQDSMLSEARKEETKERHTEIRYRKTGQENGDLPDEELVQYLIQDSADAGRVFSFWLEDMTQQGKIKVFSILNPLGKNIYKMIFPYLSPKAQEILRASLGQNIPEVSPEQRAGYIRELKNMIQVRVGIDPLGFISMLPGEELFMLLDKLSPQQAIILFGYIGREKITEYFDHISAERAAEIIKGLKNKPEYTADEIEDLGNFLTLRLYEGRYVKHHLSGDAKDMTGALIGMDLDKQDKILEMLFEKDEEMYQELKKHILVLEDIPHLDMEIIREATQDFTTEEIVTAYRFKPFSLQPVVDARPAREQQLIYDLYTKMDAVPRKEAELLTREVLKRIYNLNKMR